MAYPLDKKECESLGTALNYFVENTEERVRADQIGPAEAHILALLINDIDIIYDRLCEIKYPAAARWTQRDDAASNITLWIKERAKERWTGKDAAEFEDQPDFAPYYGSDY